MRGRGSRGYGLRVLSSVVHVSVRDGVCVCEVGRCVRWIVGRYRRAVFFWLRLGSMHLGKRAFRTIHVHIKYVWRGEDSSQETPSNLLYLAL